MKKIIADEEVLRTARMRDFFENVKEKGRKAKKGILDALQHRQQKIHTCLGIGAPGREPYTFLVFVHSSLVFLYFTIRSRFVPETKGLTVAQITEHSKFKHSKMFLFVDLLLTVGKYRKNNTTILLLYSYLLKLLGICIHHLLQRRPLIVQRLLLSFCFLSI